VVVIRKSMEEALGEESPLVEEESPPALPDQVLQCVARS